MMDQRWSLGPETPWPLGDQAAGLASVFDTPGPCDERRPSDVCLVVELKSWKQLTQESVG